ncbi:Fc.00g107020.m01.CDS01 [Cosmosporella sp. VM-42]
MSNIAYITADRELSHDAVSLSDHSDCSHSAPRLPSSSPGSSEGTISERLSASDQDEGRYSIDDVERRADDIFINATYPRDIFYGPAYLTLVPLWDQENHAVRIKKVAFDPKHHPDVRAHAVLQYALCLLSSFGVVEDHDQGLEWFYSAAKAGNRQARAFVHRLFRSYGHTPPDCHQSLEWLIAEAKDGSQWALDELQREDPSSHETTLKEKTYQLAMPGRDSELRQTLNLTDAQILEEQLESGEQAERASLDTADGSRSKYDLWFYRDACSWACVYSTVEVFSFANDDMVRNNLITALLIGRVDIAHYILDSKAGRNNYHDGLDCNPLFFLLQISDDEVDGIVRKLVNMGEDVHEQVMLQEPEWRPTVSSYPFSPRQKMAQYWKYQTRGVSITPLRWAITNHKAALVKVLLDLGATFPKVPDAITYKVLHSEAFAAGLPNVAVLDVPCYDIGILKMFLDRHGNQTKQAVFAETPLGLIATEPNSPERRLRLGELATPEYLFPVLTLLRSYQLGSDAELFRAADKSAMLNDELMPSIQGARQTEWGISRSKEAPSNQVGMGYYGRVAIPIKGCTPVGIVLERWDMFLPEDMLRLLKLLCVKGDDLSCFYTRPNIKQAVLHLLACHPVLLRTGALEYMLEQGHSVGLHINIQDAHGDAPLHYASLLRGSTQGPLITKLVDMGADPNIHNKYEMTASDIRFFGHLHEFSETEKFPEKTLQLDPARRIHGNKGHAIRGRRGDKGGSERDGPYSVLWASLCDGVAFRRVWDIDARADHLFDEDLIVRLLVGEGEQGDHSFVDE